MPAPQIISELVERFKFNINDYKQGSYNETQVRREFIDPFFKALGWDISNEKGYAEAYKDVVHEYSLKTKDKAEAPDYLFRIGGTKKFFVEAKKPSVNLRDDISPAFQLRRYAWSAKLPLSILTDFEELVIYDCRIQPKKTDKPSTGRIKYYSFEEYIEKWDEIESIFSREAVLKGSFDKYAESNKGKRGTAEVDDAFLKEIENWREILARNIALRNEHLSNRELNFAVQKTIDRIIFLRICEDRGIEDYGQLMNLQNGANVYRRLLQIFTRADEKYNSGLFHFEDEKNRNEEPDKITPAISIDDKVLKEIIKNLYYPDSPYEFSVLPSDILGHVYEQFLGKVIRLTAGHRAVVEEKPEVKKAGGVYYTPTYIVDYIVNNTLGKKLEEIEAKIKPGNDASIKKALKEASELKVLDPACGSGSFLIDAYQYLLDWHLKLYSVETSRQVGTVSLQRNSPVYQTKDGDYRLTTSEKKRILLNNIYGVDIDSQAVEVTKLSLLLKVLEGETDESLFTQISLFRERALPDLSSNIKCGNSLIGPDFYEQTELNLDEEEHYRINVFDWNEEFKEIMNDGGFDCVIGNPPYLKITKNSVPNNILQYYEDNYVTIAGGSSKNLFQLFVERVLTLNPTHFSFIVPEALCTTSSNGMLRKIILDKYFIDSICYFDNFVFKDATIGTIIFVLNKSSERNEYELINLLSTGEFKIKSTVEYKDGINEWKIRYNPNVELLRKLEDGSNLLGEIAVMSKGMVVKDRTKHLREKRRNKDLPFLLGKSISRYKMQIKYFTDYDELEIIGGTRNLEKHTNVPRILIRRTGNVICCVYSEQKSLIESTLYLLWCENVSLIFLTGLLNSKLMTFFLQNGLLTNEQGYPQVLMWQLEKLPIKIPSFKDINKIEIKVKQIINLKSSIDNTKTPQEKKNLERQIAALDKQIDKLVYELYGLTEDEIKIVEESVK